MAKIKRLLPPAPNGDATQPPSSPPPLPADQGCEVEKTEDLFDLNKLRITTDFDSEIELERVISTVPVRKPGKEHFIRTHPGSDYRVTVGLIELKEEGTTYLVVDQALREKLLSEPTYVEKTLVTAMTANGILFLWPLRGPGRDGRLDAWSLSAIEAAKRAEREWVRVIANMTLGAYNIVIGRGIHKEPVWPQLTLGELIRVAFQDKFINHLDHPVLKSLRGEVG